MGVATILGLAVGGPAARPARSVTYLYLTTGGGSVAIAVFGAGVDIVIGLVGYLVLRRRPAG